MKNVVIYSVVVAGIFLLFFGIRQEPFLKFLGFGQGLAGTAAVPIVSDQGEIKYEAKIKNPLSTPIRLCGGQMNWCGQSGCYKVITPFPIMIEPKQEVTVIVSISPREEKLSETELILYADGKGLNGLTPVKIKLPAVSRNVQ